MDTQLRQYRDTSNWNLTTPIFPSLTKVLGPVDIDLFTGRMIKQLDKYVSWKPDPGAWKTDAFSIKWADLKAYTFPPYCLKGHCLARNPVKQSSNSTANTILVHPNVVHNNTRNAYGRPSVDYKSSELTDLPSEPSTSSDDSRSFSRGVESHMRSGGKQQISSKVPRY